MSVTVVPDEFRWVRFDASVIAALAADVAARVGLEGVEIEIEVDERTSTTVVELSSLDPVRCRIESGAIEDSRRLREFSHDAAEEALGRLLLEASDRRDPSFGAPPLDEVLDVSARIAWDTYVVGRLVRFGGRDQSARRRYLFRARFGFSDASDLAFDRLWSADGLTYEQVVALPLEEVVG